MEEKRFEISLMNSERKYYVIAINYQRALEKINAHNEDVRFSRPVSWWTWDTVMQGVMAGNYDDENCPHFVY